MARPDRLVLVTGTGTDVGKTWVTVELIGRLRARGVAVAARKPAQSFAVGDATTDASLLGAACGECADAVCPPHRWYPVPLAPPMAANALDRERIAVEDLVGELTWPAGASIGFVEGAGGLRSPIAHDGDSLSLVRLLEPDLVLLVADPALGVVSTVRMTADELGDQPLLVLLNRYDEGDDVHRRSLDWLRAVDGLTVDTDLTAVTDRLTALVA